MTGGTISTHGHITLRTALEAHGTGADTTIHGTAARITGTHGRTRHTDTMAGTIRSTWADGMTLGTMATADGMEVGTTHITDTCTLTTAVGMEVGTHTGATTRTITTLST